MSFAPPFSSHFHIVPLTVFIIDIITIIIVVIAFLGSIARAGNGEFQMYRGIRRREFKRQEYFDKKALKVNFVDTSDIANKSLGIVVIFHV